MPTSEKLSEPIDSPLTDSTSMRLLFVIDLDRAESFLDVTQDSLLRANVLSRSHAVSLVCLYSKESDKVVVGRNLAAGEQDAIGIHYLRKEPQQLAPGLMSQACLNAYLFYQWLKAHAGEFDLVQACDADNVLYFALIARKLGMHFNELRFAHYCAAPILYCRDANHEPVDSFVDLVQVFMERQSFAMTDYVVSRSKNLLDWLKSNGYRAEGQQCQVLPPLVPAKASGQSGERARSPGRGFVYLGSLRSRTDLLTYLDACKRVIRLCHDQGITPATFDIVFVSETKVPRFALRAMRNLFDAGGVTWSVRQANLFEFIDSGEAKGRLALLPRHQPGPGVLAVKALQAGVPVLAVAGSGVDELRDQSRQPAPVDAHPYPLSQEMMNWLVRGRLEFQAVYDTAEVLAKYNRWYEAMSAIPDSDAGDVDERPLVSVCIAHFNRPAELRQALASVSRLRYPNLEVIVVDDGSTDAEAIRYLQSLEQHDYAFDVRVFTQPNLYLGASRNLAARNARGQYMLFMDDDNLAKADELDVMVAAAEYSQADILTCFADAFIKGEEVDTGGARNRIVFTGPDIAAGFFRNPYGDSNCLVRKRSFDELGGFSEDFKIGRDDQEFFSRAVIKGYRLLVVPEALYWYKINTTRMRLTQFSQYAGLRRVARPYFEETGLDAHWVDMLRYAQGLSSQKSGVTARGLRRFAQNNRLRMIAYAFPALYKWLRPLIRRL